MLKIRMKQNINIDIDIVFDDMIADMINNKKLVNSN